MIYNDLDLSPTGILTLGFLAVSSGEKISRKEALSFSLTHLGHKMELREKNQ